MAGASPGLGGPWAPSCPQRAEQLAWAVSGLPATLRGGACGVRAASGSLPEPCRPARPHPAAGRSQAVASDA